MPRRIFDATVICAFYARVSNRHSYFLCRHIFCYEVFVMLFLGCDGCQVFIHFLFLGGMDEGPGASLKPAFGTAALPLVEVWLPLAATALMTRVVGRTGWPIGMLFFSY